MNIFEATDSYEAWLNGHVALWPDELALKHARMSGRDTPFPFFRGTYYRWLQHWPKTCPELVKAPEVLAIGDIHIENFGTWRDAESRLAWGVNDFDEADMLPYTQDLVRLTASALLAIKAGELRHPSDDVASTILAGYERGLSRGGRPFILGEKNRTLRRLTLSAPRDPRRFWAKIRKASRETADEITPADCELLLSALPKKSTGIVAFRRLGVGMGSLGKPRYAAMAAWEGGSVCRELKAHTPPAGDWVRGVPGSWAHYAAALNRSNRSPDPCLHLKGKWILRRLTPDCSRIALDALATVHDVRRLLRSMGREVANVHMGSTDAMELVRADLAKRPQGWLHRAARKMIKAIVDDWEKWKREEVWRLPLRESCRT